MIGRKQNEPRILLWNIRTWGGRTRLQNSSGSCCKVGRPPPGPGGGKYKALLCIFMNGSVRVRDESFEPGSHEKMRPQKTLLVAQCVEVPTNHPNACCCLRKKEENVAAAATDSIFTSGKICTLSTPTHMCGAPPQKNLLQIRKLKWQQRQNKAELAKNNLPIKNSNQIQHHYL